MTLKTFWVYGDHAGVKYPVHNFPTRAEAEQYASEYAREKPDEYQEITIEEGEKDKPAY